MSKLIFDPIHGYMSFDALSLSIIDTPIFRRLRNIKQLGTCYDVFPGASHNRFEHSLGVGHLANLMITTISQNQPELKITKRNIQLVTIAGLCHDLGHGPFSHVFDNEVIDTSLGSINIHHEERSKMLLHKIVTTNNIDINEKELNTIMQMISPDENHKDHYLYQIVANEMNGIDVDKFDYLNRDPRSIGLSYSYDFSRLIKQARVVDNIICFPLKIQHQIFELFYTRYRLHKEIYNHPVVKSIEYLLSDILKSSDKYLGISASIDDATKFSHLTDNLLHLIGSSTAKDLLHSRKLYKRYLKRDLYVFVGSYFNPKIQEFFNEQLKTECILQCILPKIDIHNKISYYTIKEPNKKVELQLKSDIKNQTNEYRVFCKDSSLVKNIKKQLIKYV